MKGRALKLHEDYNIYDGNFVTVEVSVDPENTVTRYARVTYMEDLCAFVLTYFEDESYTTPKMKVGENGRKTLDYDFVYEVSLDSITPFE